MRTQVKVTKTCPICRYDNVTVVDREAFFAWMKGKMIQDAMPELTPSQREALMTGMHDKCWDMMTKGIR